VTVRRDWILCAPLVAAPPINERRYGATSAARILGRTTRRGEAKSRSRIVSQAEIAYRNLFRCRDASGKSTARKISYTVQYNGDIATGMDACKLYCNVVFSSSCGEMTSEFGVPRRTPAWRARGPPMAETETGRQYLTILSQPPATRFSALCGVFESFPPVAIAGLSYAA
jgi:hypothetical protein